MYIMTWKILIVFVYCLLVHVLSDFVYSPSIALWDSTIQKKILRNFYLDVSATVLPFPTDELTALSDFYYSTNGELWNWRENSTTSGIPWNFTQANPNPCTQNWQGVVCTSNCSNNEPCNVKELFLGSYGIIGSIPTSFGNLLKLKFIDLSHNQINGNLPPTFWQLINLQDVFMENNNITGSIPIAFQNLKKLRFFYFQFNELNGTLPDVFHQTSQLIGVALNNNQLKGTIPESLLGLTKLQYLYLSYNHFSGTLSSTIGQLISAYVLYLDFNNFHGTLPSEIGNLTYIQFLDINGNAFTGTLPSSIGNCTGLIELTMNSNHFHGQIPASIGNLTYLVALIMQDNSFSGTIPPELGRLHDVSGINVGSNYLTGTLPTELVGLRNIMLIFVQDNFLCGNIDAASTWHRIFNFNVSNNFFTGSVNHVMHNLIQTIELDLSSNLFMGTLDYAFTQMANLSLLIVRNNEFTGSLDHLTNTSLQQVLTVVDVSDNQFLGNLPTDPFHSPLLFSFAAVKNCISGSIPAVICQNRKLRTLALDGLNTAESCQDLFFPTIRQIQSYELEAFLPGGLPGCLFNMSSLETLHLSGNGIAGKIPEDISIGKYLKDLSLSYNQLSGRIPSLIQEHGWTNLDLSFNKLDGVLSSTFAVPGNTSSLTLSVNRLSGSIPSSLLDAEQIDILKGNVFSCDNSRAYGGNSNDVSRSLPKHDKHANSYDCGSDTVNTSLYIWVSFVGLLFLIAALIVGGGERIKGKGLFENRAKSWYSMVKYKVKKWSVNIMDWYSVYSGLAAEDFYKQKISQLYVLGKSMKVLRKMSSLITLFALLILMPSYGILTIFYSSHSYSYAWTAALAYLSGLAPAIILMGIISLAYILFARKFNTFITESSGIYWNTNHENAITQNGKENAESSEDSRLHSDSLSSEDQTRGHSIVSIRSISVVAIENLSNYMLFWLICYDERDLSSGRRRYNWHNIWIGLQVLVLNCTVVLIVNILYVYITTLGLSSMEMTWIVFGISIFKLFWSYVVVLGFFADYLRRNSRNLDGSQQNISMERHVSRDSIRRVQFLAHIFIFNNILAPFLADAFVDPSCFYYMIQSASSVDVSYELRQCGGFKLEEATIFCLFHVYNKRTVSYLPPFVYSFQCSSALLSGFAGVFVYRYLLSGILGPIAFLTFRKLQENNITIPAFLRYWLEGGIISAASMSAKEQFMKQSEKLTARIGEQSMAKTASNDALNEMVQNAEINLNEEIPEKARRTFAGHMIFNKESFVVIVIGDLGVMVTFGLAFPPICLVVAFSIMMNSYAQQLLIGRYVVLSRQLSLLNQHEKDRQKLESYMERLERECGDLMKLFWPAIPTLSFLSASFIGFFLFDILGDQVGVSNGIWILIVMTSIPVWIWIVVKKVVDIEKGKPDRDVVAINNPLNSMGTSENESQELESQEIELEKIYQK